MQRQAFIDSPQCKELDQIFASVISKTGVVKGSKPTDKSGKFIVRIPKTVHYKLDIEAKREGVSLNQLAACKLSIPFGSSGELKRELVVDAFNAVHGGYSTDWVIVERALNNAFLSKCSQLGLTENAWVLNHTLMNIRKTAKYSARLNKATKRSGFDDYDGYAFAAEIAIRILQRTEGVTLDRVLCDPQLRDQYEQIAVRIAPGTFSLKLLCAALNLRKTHRLKPVDRSIKEYDLVAAGPLKRVDLSTIAAMPGGYALYDHSRPIFAGETENLHKRIAIHAQAGLADWLDDDCGKGLTLKTLVLPSAKRDIRLSWLTSFINAERPLLNYQIAA
ncbi:MAG: toxin-antitoxin system HicB family antitoxin [Planctomycetes bacterium]|nr:toxin-antitoxin system HicB family antitoxin [Planctomycetota bacterium]